MNTLKKSLIPKHLCTRCGACAAICPGQLIRLNKDLYPFRISHDDCRRCEKCLRVCPGLAVDFSPLPGSHKQSPFLGNYLDLYEGTSRNISVLENASSGGCVTALLLDAQRTGLIEAAAVVAMSPGDPTRAIYQLATNADAIRHSGQAKFQIASLAEVIPGFRKFKKIAFVGLPCHIQALRKYEALDPDLKKRVRIHLGTYCNGVCDYRGTRFLLNKLGVRFQEIKSLEYRHGPWPGYLRVGRPPQEPITMRRNLYQAFLYLHYAPRCLYCIDFCSELADISFGDAKETNRRGSGRFSQVLVRSAVGKAFLAALPGALALTPIAETAIISSQKFQFEFKKIGARQRLKMLRRRPLYHNSSFPAIKPRFWREIRFLLIYHSRHLARIVLWLLPRPLIMKLSRHIFERVHRNKL